MARNSRAGNIQVDNWVAKVLKVKSWSENADLRPSTLEIYKSHLYLYWTRYLHSKAPDVETWLSRVKDQQHSEEKDIVNDWASDLQRFFKTYSVKNTGRQIGTVDKRLYAAAVCSFLNHYLPREVSFPYKIEPTVEELQAAQKTAMSFDEVLVSGCEVLPLPEPHLSRLCPC